MAQFHNAPSDWLSVPTTCLRLMEKAIWSATWQNQQNGCAPSEDSDQPGHSPSLIRVFAVHMKKAWVLSYQLSAQRRLWSLGAHSFCWFCHVVAHLFSQNSKKKKKSKKNRPQDFYDIFNMCKIQDGQKMIQLILWIGILKSILELAACAKCHTDKMFIKPKMLALR